MSSWDRENGHSDDIRLRLFYLFGKFDALTRKVFFPFAGVCKFGQSLPPHPPPSNIYNGHNYE